MKRYSVRWILMIAVGLSVLLLSHQIGSSGSMETKQVVDRRLVLANTKFGFKLFREIVKQDEGKNIFLSPSSVALALAMVYNGSAGETFKAISNTLALGGITLNEVNSANLALREMLEDPDPKVQLMISNSLWARKDILFKPSFLERNKEFYGAEVENLDFNAPHGVSIINAWVNNKTNNKIEKIIEGPIDPLTILFIINAVYFKGNWTVEFDKKDSRERIFTMLDGAQKKHPMMSQFGFYKYYRGKNFQAVSLPYGRGRVSMYIFLPDKDSYIGEFFQSLGFTNWEVWMSNFEEMEGTIVIPRFKLEYEVILNDALKALGMGVAFDRNRANFENMCSIPPNVYIRKVKHKTFVEVNEEGTESTAVTSVEMKTESVRETFTMIVDRPFFCAIRDNETGTVLFMGSIVDPTNR